MISFLGRFRFTLVFLLFMVLANGLAGSWAGPLPQILLQRWGLGLDPLLRGEAFRLFTALFLSHDAGMFFRQAVFALSVIGLCEWRFGWRRTLAVFAVTDLAGSLLLLFAVIAPLDGFASRMFDGIAGLHDVGMSGGGFGLLGAMAASLPGKWRLRFVLLAALGLAAKPLLSFDLLADILHALTFTIGLGIGRYFPAETPSDAATRE